MKIICNKLILKYSDNHNKLFLYVLLAVQAIKVYTLNITLLIINVVTLSSNATAIYGRLKDSSS